MTAAARLRALAAAGARTARRCARRPQQDHERSEPPRSTGGRWRSCAARQADLFPMKGLRARSLQAEHLKIKPRRKQRQLNGAPDRRRQPDGNKSTDLMAGADYRHGAAAPEAPISAQRIAEFNGADVLWRSVKNFASRRYGLLGSVRIVGMAPGVATLHVPRYPRLLSSKSRPPPK